MEGWRSAQTWTSAQARQLRTSITSSALLKREKQSKPRSGSAVYWGRNGVGVTDSCPALVTAPFDMHSQCEWEQGEVGEATSRREAVVRHQGTRARVVMRGGEVMMARREVAPEIKEIVPA